MSEPFNFAAFATERGMNFHHFALCPAAWLVPIKFTLWHMTSPTGARILAIVPNQASPQSSAFSAYQSAVAVYPVADAEAAFVAYCLFNGG